MTDHLFGCGPSRAADGGASVTQRAARSGEFVIDLHCHVHIHSADELLQDGFQPQAEPMLEFASSATRETNKAQMRTVHTKLTSVHERLQDMDRLGIDVQTLSPSPFQFCYWAEPERGLAAARLVNDGVAEMVANAPGRFVGLGTVPLQAPDLAVIELERLVRKLGLRGVEVATSVQGEELSHTRFRPFFAKAEELGILIFLHPNGFSDGRRLADHYFINIIGNPLDATIAVSHLIFDGVLDAMPGLKLCVAHGGGFLPAYAARMDHAHAARADCRRCIQQPPSSYLRRLYFDTVVFSASQLGYLIKEYGADHIVLGTDYPYDMAEPDPVGLVSRVANLGAKERAEILGGNAARLLGLRAEDLLASRDLPGGVAP
jgi:aminocarboxymuconate-semialdehyde decarboxylase